MPDIGVKSCFRELQKKKSNEKFAALLESLVKGYCLIKMIVTFSTLPAIGLPEPSVF